MTLSLSLKMNESTGYTSNFLHTFTQFTQFTFTWQFFAEIDFEKWNDTQQDLKGMLKIETMVYKMFMASIFPDHFHDTYSIVQNCEKNSYLTPCLNPTEFYWKKQFLIVFACPSDFNHQIGARKTSFISPFAKLDTSLQIELGRSQNNQLDSASPLISWVVSELEEAAWLWA